VRFLRFPVLSLVVATMAMVAVLYAYEEYTRVELLMVELPARFHTGPNAMEAIEILSRRHGQEVKKAIDVDSAGTDTLRQ
jgi:uncharacterized protein with PIN domain